MLRASANYLWEVTWGSRSAAPAAVPIADLLAMRPSKRQQGLVSAKLLV